MLRAAHTSLSQIIGPHCESLCSSVTSKTRRFLWQMAYTNHVQNYSLQQREIYVPVQINALYAKSRLLRIHLVPIMFPEWFIKT